MYWTKSRLLDCKIMFEKSCQSSPANFLVTENTGFMNVIFHFLSQEYEHEDLVKLLKKFSKFLLYFLFHFTSSLIMAITYRHSSGRTWYCWGVTVMGKRFNYLGSVVVIHCSKRCCSRKKIVVLSLSVFPFLYTVTPISTLSLRS